MKLPRKIFEYCILDVNNNFHYIDNGLIKKMPITFFSGTDFSPWLPQSPTGWKEFQISFGTNQKYWSLNRSFTVPLTFVGDGAEILRWYQYKGRGYSEELYVMILRQNRETGIYELEYKGQIDLSKFSDDPVRGVTVNTIEGGLLSFLNSRDGTTYELLCDETNPEIIKVFDDGITLQDRFNFQFLDGIDIYDREIEHDDLDIATLPTVFVNNEGDNVGIVHGDQSVEDATDPAYPTTSANYIFYSIFGVSNMRISGSVKFSKADDDTSFSTSVDCGLKYITSLGNEGIIMPEQIFQFDREYTFDTGYVVDLQPNEKLFIGVFNTFSLAYIALKVKSTEFYFDFLSRNASSEFFALRPLSVLKQLVSLMTDGKYTADSAWFTAHNNICCTCGDAIRNTSRSVVPNYKMAMTFEEFFTSYSSIYNLGVKVVNNVLYVEPKADLYKADAQIFDLGEVADLKINCATEYLANLFNCGYPDQSYDSTSASNSGGKYEPNSTQQYKLPTTVVNKPLDITSKFRGDARGIEAILGGLLNKDSTDNSGDKQVFMVNISDETIQDEFIADSVGQDHTGANFVIFNSFIGDNFDWIDPATKNGVVFTGDFQTVNIKVTLIIDFPGINVVCYIYKNGVSIAFIGSTATDGVTPIYILANGISLVNGDTLQVYIIPSDNFNPFAVYTGILNVVFTTLVYTLKRIAYDSITGVIDNTVYNIDEMTPHRQLLAWMNYIAALFYQQPSDSVTFQTGLKNVLLSTTKDGVTITENSNEVIGNYKASALFIPYIIECKAKVPYTFSQVMSLMGTGYIKMTFNNVPVYGLPIGSMTSKPPTQEAQTWSMLAAPINSLDNFLKLDVFGIYLSTQNHTMFLSDYNPVQWIRYNLSLQSKYQYKDMYDDWSYKRFERYAVKPFYAQKWQLSDTVKIQAVVTGITGLSVFVYDEWGKQYAIVNLTITPNTALQLPYILYQGSIDLSAYAEGRYLFVIKSSALEALAVSEWQDIKQSHLGMNGLPNTYMYEYSNTYNKHNTFFNSWGQVMFRCESIFAITDPDAEFTVYEDEPGDLEMLNGVAFEKQKLIIGDGLGVPDWVAKKINLITLNNELLVEGKGFTRNSEAKLESTFRPGYPFNKYAIELRPAQNMFGLEVVADEETTDSNVTSWTLDAQVLGLGEETINVEIKNT